MNKSLSARLQIATRHLAEEMMAGLYHSAFKGQGMEFEEVREYQAGDEIRHIDWNVTARLQHPYIKVFKEEREITLWLVADISLSMQYGSKVTLKRDYMAEVIALIAFAAAKNNDRIGLILFSQGVDYLLPPGKGNKHAMHIVREALLRPPRQRQPKGDPLEVTLMLLGHLQKKKCVCFLLSDFFYDFQRRSVLLFAKKHDLIALMISDPSEKLFPLNGLINMLDAESSQSLMVDWGASSKFMSLKQLSQSHCSLLESCGADVLPLDTDTPCYPVLKKFFRLRAQRRHRL